MRVAPPLLGRLLVRARRLGDRAATVEADFQELLEIRAAESGARAARRRYVADALSLWTHQSSEHIFTDIPRKRGSLMQDLWNDIRYGFRMMWKSPGFTAVALLSLALGIGANTTLFSIADTVLFRELSAKAPGELVLFNWQAPRAFRTPGLRGTFVPGDHPPGWWGSSTFHHRMFTQFTAQQRDAGSPLSHIFAFASLSMTASTPRTDARVVDGQVVSGGYFDGLGVNALMGRTIGAQDDAATAAPVAVISHRYWQREFGGDPSVVNQTITVNQVPVTVIGVMGDSFRGPWQVGREPDISVPTSLGPVIEKGSPLVEKPGRRTPYWLLVMGRLKPGATREQAQAYFAGSFQAIALELVPPPRRPGEPVTLEAKDYPQLLMLPGSRGLWELRKIYSSRIAVLFGSVGLVLLIACANVANLLLSRSATRGTEITLRLAMGAGRGRVVRQLLTESVLLAAVGGALGALLSIWGTRALGAFGETGGLLPEGMTYGLNWRVLGFTAAASILTGALFGAVPALRASRRDLTTALKDTTRTGTHASRSWFSRGLIVTQVAMSLVLLLAAGLLVRTLVNLQRVNTGFNQENLLVFQVRPGNAGWTGERIRAFYSELASRLDALPGVRSATFAQMPLVAHYMYGLSAILPGETAGAAPYHATNYLIVRDNFTSTMEIPVVRGRAFTPQDGAGPKVALVNETFAREYLAGKDPIGQRIGIEDVEGPIEIVGLTRDIVYNSQREDKTPLVYVPWRQEGPMPDGAFAIRTAGDPLLIAADVRQAVRAVAPAVAVEDLTTQRELSAATLAEERQYAALIGLAAILAVGLAAIGLYGVIAYWVTQRTREIGIRMALGAQTGSVLRLVVRQALFLVVAGLVIGGLASAWLAKFIESRLYQVRPSDPFTIAAVTLVVVAMALAACLVPARRAAKLDPMIAFRID